MQRFITKLTLLFLCFSINFVALASAYYTDSHGFRRPVAKSAQQIWAENKAAREAAKQAAKPPAVVHHQVNAQIGAHAALTPNPVIVSHAAHHAVGMLGVMAPVVHYAVGVGMAPAAHHAVGVMMPPAAHHAVGVMMPPAVHYAGVGGALLVGVGGGLPIAAGVGFPVGVGGGLPIAAGGVFPVGVGGALPVGGYRYIIPLVNPLPQRATANNLFEQIALTELIEPPGHSLIEREEFNINKTYSVDLEEITLDLERRVVWAKVFGLFSDHKTKKEILGYENTQIGRMIGFDTKLTDDFVLGVAYTNVYSKIKFKDDKSVNNHEFTSHIATIYTRYNFNSGLFLHSQLRYGQAFIDTLSDYGGRSLYSDSRANIYGGNLEVGKGISLRSPLILTPKLALSYNEIKVPGLEETGMGFSTKISAKREKRAIVAPTIALKSIIQSRYSLVIPEIYFNFAKAFYAKSSLPIITMDLGDKKIEVVNSQGKIPKKTYTVGCSFNVVKKRGIKFGINYSYSFAPKSYSTNCIAAKFRISL